jgi:hypothetical protein|tara:strand:+ start:111 stop:239 length:129 start_codon:yes stop_codon:yes gene_type:complete
MINTYLSLEYISNIIILLFAIIMILFGTGSVYLNMEKDRKDE